MEKAHAPAETFWQRLGRFLEALDGAFDPSAGDRARILSLESRVAQLESQTDAADPLG